DAIRTAPSRGVNYQVIGDLRAEYDQKCREEERAARKQANDDDRLEREKNTAQIYAAQQARSEQARAEAQCQAMREVLASRRANVDRMSPGEKSNFQTLQASFNDRCVKPH
ncbi:MAG TPA: hypothetical protein VFM48_14640, partial [Aquabacterium sp.]|nr:hypothetical protein [Aquabacterium sp.]